MQQSRATGLSDGRLWRYLRRFRREGLLGLNDRRQMPHPWGKTSIEALLPRHVQQHLVPLAIAHPFTDRELARIVQVAYHLSVDQSRIPCGGCLPIDGPNIRGKGSERAN